MEQWSASPKLRQNFLDIRALDALPWELQRGYAPPPPVAKPEGLDTPRQAPCASGGPFFCP